MPELPGGTVTPLLTNIEGSTRLLRRLGDPFVVATNAVAAAAEA